MANQEMRAALTFAGYEVAHDWGEGGHNGSTPPRSSPRRRWLWKGYPAPIVANAAGASKQDVTQLTLPARTGRRFSRGR